MVTLIVPALSKGSVAVIVTAYEALFSWSMGAPTVIAPLAESRLKSWLNATAPAPPTE